MSDFVFLNGQIIKHENAKIFVDDRGFHFGDGLYDVMLFCNNKIIDFDAHFKRMEKTAKRLYIYLDCKKDEIFAIIHKLSQKNNIKNGRIVIVITRGSSDRWHKDLSSIRQNIFIQIQKYEIDFSLLIEKISIKTEKDIRWAMRDIKTTNLLPAVIIREKIKKNGFDDAIFFDSKTKIIHEASRANVFIVKKNEIITPPLSKDILSGITRARIIKLLKKNKRLKIIEKDFKIKDLHNADEIFLTASTARIVNVKNIDGIKKNQSKISEEILKIYHEFLRN